MNDTNTDEAAHSAVHQDNIEITAERLYSTYCGASANSGLVWDALQKEDPSDAEAWKAVAADAIEMVSWQINSAIERKAEVLTFNIDGKDTPRMVFFLDGGDKQGPPIMTPSAEPEPSLIVVE